jgi:2-keto-4-pentenoate hydratase/2-oxohepta-3-ene-1,7-dioic acid hydratase in catechol pathway
MNINDVSARDIQLGSSQWMMGKTFDTFCPMGPWLVTADEIADPHNLPIWLTVNGEKLQNSNTRELIFNIPHLIEYLSAILTLEPGDILDRNAGGCGSGLQSPKWLKPGDEVVVCVEGLGQLEHLCGGIALLRSV